MLLRHNKIQGDELLTKQSTDGATLSADELLNIKISIFEMDLCQSLWLMQCKNAIKTLAEIAENTGLPVSIRVDNAKAFRSKIFQKELLDKGIRLIFGTPNVHTAVGTVERHIRTLQNYVRPFLLEGNLLKFAARRAVKTMRFTFHTSIKTTPYQMLTNQRPRNVLDKFFDSEHPGMTLMTVLKDLDGKIIGSESKVPQEIEVFESSRRWGRSRNVQELRRYVNESSKLSKMPETKVRKFVVEKTRNRKGWNSKFQDKPLLVTSKTVIR